MAGRNTFSDVSANQPGVTLVSCRLTFAADAEANGCAVTKSNGYVSSCARSAEGIWIVTFADSWYRCLGVAPVLIKADTILTVTAQSLADSSPTLTLLFETADTGADADPDSVVLDVTFIMKNSGAAEGA
jgi:hypothetical protein